MRAFVFPGQGAQFIGMGMDFAKEFPEAQSVFDEVDAALGEKLSDLIWSGDIDTLTLTRNAQPALMAVSLAVMRVMEHEGLASDNIAYVAGHSLGEYSALAAAGALDIGECAKLLRIRGDAMQSAVAPGVGAMAALLGLGFEAVSDIARDVAEGEICQAANDNDPSQVVVSGHKAAVERAIELAKAKGAKRALLLPVSAPFHCALMAPAAEAMEEALANANLRSPKYPLVSNVKASAVQDPEEIRQLLIAQVTGSVRWRESIAWMAQQGVREIWEIGAGKALCGMNKRIERSLLTQPVGHVSDIEKARAHLLEKG